MRVARRGARHSALLGFAWVAFVACFCCALEARADAGLDTYEQARLGAILAHDQLEIDSAPQGKTVAYIRYERREVFESDELVLPIVLPKAAPTWPNAFHWLTEQPTIARELLLREGEPFDAERAEESMRNLRELGIFALVRIVPIKTADPRKVGVLVYTRDLWSLRLEESFAGAGTTLSFGVQLVERNFLGRDKELAARFLFDPLTYSVGQTYLDPRMFGGTLRLYEAFDVIVNRASGRVEGTTGSVLWGMPFHDLAQERSFDVLAQYADLVTRDAPGGKVVGFDASPGTSHGDSCAPGVPNCIARVWDERRVRIEGVFNERIGERYKQTFTLGAGAADRAVGANAETGLLPALRPVFTSEVLPRVRREVYPVLRYRLSLPRFATFTNLGSFGQSETVQVGPALDARFAFPLSAFGSSSDGFVTRGTAGYVWGFRDALVDVKGQASARLDGPAVIDQEAIFQLRGATPTFRWAFGRFVLRGLIDARRHDSQRTVVAVGGDDGLRGYAAQQFYAIGGSRWLGNFEYRTRPIEIRSVQLGLVAFYDAGSAYSRVSAMRLHHSLGAGLRVLFPQFNRYPFRVDVGLPLDSSGFAVLLSYSSEQMIALTQSEDDLRTTNLSLY